MRDAGFIERRSVRQAYDEKAGMFLPDRFVRGTCPNCKSLDQYGDACEVCGSTYTPAELIDPVSTVTNTTPVWRSSEHLFFKLSAFQSMLSEYVAEAAPDSAVRGKLNEWLRAGLQDWDISRDAPYFGFEIPDAPGKYFYVWFDATIGYIASFEAWRAPRGVSFDDYWDLRPPPSSTTSSARTSAIFTRCSGRRYCRARGCAGPRQCSHTAS